MIDPLPPLLFALPSTAEAPAPLPWGDCFRRGTCNLHVAKPSGHFSVLMADTVSHSLSEASSSFGVFLSLFLWLPHFNFSA